jgi:DNA-binding XRE family transcriptional regulator
MAGVSPTTLSAIERWNYQPRDQVRKRIALALGVPEREIWPEVGESVMPKAVSSPHCRCEAVTSRLQLVQAEPTAVQLVAWRKLWALLLSEGGSPSHEGQAKGSPAGGQDRTGLEDDARGQSLLMED